MKLRLVSFKLCPFVQRALIACRLKQVDFDLSYVDLADPPDWFEAISPQHKVPLLIVDDDQVLFDSAVISEFIDEITPARLHPRDPLQRALDRAWIEYGSACLMDLLHMSTAKTASEFDAAVAAHHQRLLRLEDRLGDGPYINGERLSLIDVAYAPMFMRHAALCRHAAVVDHALLPRLHRCSEALLALDEVRDSVVPDFLALYDAVIVRRQGYLAGLISGEAPRGPGSRY